jgi:hypothetical protein
VAKEMIRPNSMRIGTTIVRHCSADALIRAEAVTFERLWLSSGTENEDSIGQVVWDFVLHVL